SIPVSFLRHLEEELQGEPLKSVVLMTDSQRHWDVKIEGGRYFKDGWQEFCLYNQLGMGDFLVFIHQSQLLFQVEVFDPTTACQRLYSPTFHRHHNCKGLEKRKVLKNKSTSKRKPLDFVVGLAAAGETSRCHVTLTSYCFKMKFIYLPMRFSRTNGFENRNYNMTLVDVDGMSWKVRLSFNRNRRQCYIRRGWSYFQVANNLNPGDILSFQLLKIGKRPILKCYGK
uniref:TF-B3 domain-containing protein n=1 Tax=Chenopodium quinoa TaxID=63459 RepID=A0A803LXU5_CHEQI